MGPLVILHCPDDGNDTEYPLTVFVFAIGLVYSHVQPVTPDGQDPFMNPLTPALQDTAFGGHGMPDAN